ncbi:DUF2322 family protein [Parasulfuritortus cantonensis]|uniref:DUF2322 family protein n=1 Tax=Parasulfuritortus cantonensis TaxID=2528202 RepID=A0A4R1BE37_9PROT|nr:DUF2322 family protein [Parasulfuritortus cantonensis]TCJ15406.1 DUF2322 family protein [Parasulfuritortus cantonensis]
MSFAEVLAGLPEVDHLSGIELTGPDGEQERVENKPGSQGSLKVYHYLLDKFGVLDRTAANAGLIMYAEHTLDARANPGKHPNIDRLLAIAADGRAWHGQAV